MSCTKEIVLEPEAAKPQISVDGAIYNNKDTQTVYLNRTQPIYTRDNPYMVTGASLSVSDDSGGSWLFTETAPGTYTAAFRGKSLHTYTLTFTSGAYTYSAQAYLPRTVKPDSLMFDFKEKGMGQDPGFEARLAGRDPRGSGENYRTKVWRNGSEYADTAQKSNEIQILNDYSINWDGLPFIPPMEFGINQFKRFKKDDIVRLWLMTTDKSTYQFLDACNREMNNGGLFAVPPGNVPTNITGGGTDITTKAVGHFAAYAVSEVNVVVPNKVILP
ncbi:MAG: DUF4249 domain-containing protein [Bacteroidota bacterium]